jgi:hypothetical protein
MRTAGWHFPIFGDVAQGQPDQFYRGVVGREMAAVFDHFPDLHVQAFDGVVSLS